MSGLFRSWGNLSLSTNRILSQIIFIEGTVFFVKAPAGVCPRNRHKLLAEIWDSRGQEGLWSGLSLPAWHWALFPNAPSLLVTSQARQSQGQLSGHKAGTWYSVLGAVALSARVPQRMRCKEMGAWQTGCREKPGLGSPAETAPGSESQGINGKRDPKDHCLHPCYYAARIPSPRGGKRLIQGHPGSPSSSCSSLSPPRQPQHSQPFPLAIADNSFRPGRAADDENTHAQNTLNCHSDFATSVTSFILSPPA